MTQDPVISAAADNAIQLARLTARMISQSSSYKEADGLGFGFETVAGDLRIIVEWQGERKLQVVEPRIGPRVVQPFDDGEGWAAELAQSLADLHALAAAKARPRNRRTRPHAASPATFS